MKITESNLKRIISEEIESAIGQGSGSLKQEDILGALELLSKANSEDLKEEIEILEELLKRAKSS